MLACSGRVLPLLSALFSGLIQHANKVSFSHGQRDKKIVLDRRYRGQRSQHETCSPNDEGEESSWVFSHSFHCRALRCCRCCHSSSLSSCSPSSGPQYHRD